jgi:hypothetical protein
MSFYRTRDVQEMLNVELHFITDLLRRRKVQRPEKDSCGQYVWWPQDIERLRVAIAEHYARRGVRGRPVGDRRVRKGPTGAAHA